MMISDSFYLTSTILIYLGNKSNYYKANEDVNQELFQQDIDLEDDFDFVSFHQPIFDWNLVQNQISYIKSQLPSDLFWPVKRSELCQKQQEYARMNDCQDVKMKEEDLVPTKQAPIQKTIVKSPKKIINVEKNNKEESKTELKKDVTLGYKTMKLTEAGIPDYK